jgi:hypothetical protein
VRQAELVQQLQVPQVLEQQVRVRRQEGLEQQPAARQREVLVLPQVQLQRVCP